MRRWVALGATTAVAAAGLGVGMVSQASAGDGGGLSATLRDAAERKVGTVVFHEVDDKVSVTATFVRNSRVVAGFHGFHIHANDLSAAGKGCMADSRKAKSTWFLSADGHYAKGGQTHGRHAGDMPSPMINGDGTGRVSFLTDRFDLDDIKGKAVIVHAGADNFANVPVGDDDEQYEANSSAATTKTKKTGNAGDRVACGLIWEN